MGGYAEMKGRGSFAETTEERPRTERWADGLAWAKRTVPDEHPPFVLVAGQMIRRSGEKPTADAIRARLRRQGQTMAQLNALDNREA